MMGSLWAASRRAPAAAAELESTAAGTKRAAELRKKISGLGTPNLGAAAGDRSKEERS